MRGRVTLTIAAFDGKGSRPAKWLQPPILLHPVVEHLLYASENVKFGQIGTSFKPIQKI